MKKIFACVTALSLMFIACGDESSTNASGREPGPATQNSAVAEGDVAKTAIANGGAGTTGYCSMNNANAGNKAYLVNTENVGYQIVIPDMDVNIGYDSSEVEIDRVGDTLRILPDSDVLVRLNWICYAYYTFDIPATETDVKYFKFDGHVFDVVPGPAPEKAPDTLCHLTRAEGKVYAEDVYDTTCTICTYGLSASGVYGSECTEFPYDVQSLSSRASLLYLGP